MRFSLHIAKHLGNLAVSNPSQRSAINQEEYLGNQTIAVLAPRPWPRDFRSAATSRVIFMLHKTRPDSRLKGWMDESCSDNLRISDIWNSATAFRTMARLSLALARFTRRSPCRLFAKRDCTAYLSVALKRNTCTLRTYETCGRDASQVNAGVAGGGKESLGTSHIIARQTDNTETRHGRH